MLFASSFRSSPLRPASLLGKRFLSLPKLSLRPDLNKYKIIEQPAGYIVGDVNDPTPRAPVDYFHGSYHWSYERMLSIALVPLTVTPFIAAVDFPVLDALLSSLILVHSHVGLTSCIIDYIPKRVYGVWHKYAKRLLLLGTTVCMYGIYEMETQDEGLIPLIRKLWTEPETPSYDRLTYAY